MKQKKVIRIEKIAKRRFPKKHTPAKTEIDPEIFELIEKIAREHSTNTFGYLTKDDLRQEIWVICLEILDDFNVKSGKLEHFLRVSVKNRLINKFKEVTKSIRPPCARCPYFDANSNCETDCLKFDNAGTFSKPTESRMVCTKWKNYILSVESRNHLLNAIEPIKEQHCENDVIDNLYNEEIIKRLYEEMPIEYINDLDSILCGQDISSEREAEIFALAKKIITMEQDNATSDAEEE